MAGVAENQKITQGIAERLANVAPKDFRDDLEYKLYQTFVLAALARNPATPQAVFDQLAARDMPEYFLAVAIIYAERATCTQIARAGETGAENEVLRSTAQLTRRRGCLSGRSVGDRGARCVCIFNNGLLFVRFFSYVRWCTERSFPAGYGEACRPRSVRPVPNRLAQRAAA